MDDVFVMENREPTYDLFDLIDEDHIRREKAKARELRRSQWWKNRKGEGSCYYCCSETPPKELTMDHIIPLARGGETKKANVVPCCKSCNRKKKNLLPVEWEEYLQSLRQRSHKR